MTITAVISPSDGGGTVDFSGTYIGANCSAVALTGNSASCTTSTLTAVGNYSVEVGYSGDTDYYGVGPNGYGSLLRVSQAPATVAVSASTPSPNAFASDTLSATVSPVPDGGTVNFADTNGAIAGCSGVAVNMTTGIASCSIASLPGAGSYGVTASYSGDTNYVANSGQLTLAIAKIPTSITVTPLPNPVTVGQTTTLTIAISPVPDGGTVTVTDAYGDLTCSSVSVATSGQGAGTATCTTRALSPGGSDSLAASFTGSSNYTPATGSSAITVNRIASTTTVSSADAYGVVGQELHVSVQVSPVPSSGTVAFSDSLGELGVCGAVSVNPSTGVASCTSGALTKAGQDLVTATFQQSATEAASTVSTTIPVDQQPSFSGSLTLNETASSPSSAAVSVAGYPAPTVTAGAALPAGLTLNANGSISGTPAFGTGGVYDLP
ncbi:MAG TPA: Ig-like domain repeat protein, partial [Thermoplasmata archaeon]|nr:Ig-like domain repeat protein [Thermoplasmata archaeon]